MKKTTVVLATLFMLFVGAQKAQALPMYYTFEGDVDNTVDFAGIIASQLGATFGVGSFITYTLIVDFDADGYETWNDGTVFMYTFPSTSDDFFYADYYSGDALWKVDGGFITNPTKPPGTYAPNGVVESNLGSQALLGSYGGFRVNSDDDYLILNAWTNVSNWGVGEDVRGLNVAMNSKGNYSSLTAALKLASICDTAPDQGGCDSNGGGESVPEPSTMLLLGFGLLGFGLFRRMRREG